MPVTNKAEVAPKDVQTPTFAELCADHQARQQIERAGGSCSDKAEDQSFQHSGVWLLAGGELALTLTAVLVAVAVGALLVKAYRAAWRALDRV